MKDEFWPLRPALHPVYARLLCAEMRRRGFAPDAILAGTRLDWQRLHEDNGFLSFEAMRRLIGQCLQLSQCPWLGMDVGFQTQVSAHGALGAAMIASRNLSDALCLVQRFSPMRQQMAVIHFRFDTDFHLELEERVPLGDIREYLLGMLVAGLAQLLTTLTGRELQTALSIEWPFARPAWAEQYQRLARTNAFGAPCLRIRIDAELLTSPSLAADEETLQLAVRDCELQLQRLQAGGSLSHRVRLQLAQSEGAMPSLDAMAAHEHMSARTFIRRLAAEQQRYQQLLDEVREERACWLLRQTELSIEAIASRLGYVDTSNFSRTFKRWLGQTPRQFRQQARLAFGSNAHEDSHEAASFGMIRQA